MNRAINFNNFVDGRSAMQGAGAIGQGLVGLGSAVGGYAKMKYKKKRDKKEDENLASKNATQLATHTMDYHKSTDTAKINSTGKVKVANINKVSDAYVSDSKKDIAKIDYKKSTDTAKINSTGKVKVANIDYDKSIKTANINKKAKVTSASIGASAKKYAANVSASNNKRTTSTLTATTKEKTKAQKYVADKNLESAKVKKKPKKAESWKIKALKNAKTVAEREKILAMKDIGDEDI